LQLRIAVAYIYEIRRATVLCAFVEISLKRFEIK